MNLITERLPNIIRCNPNFTRTLFVAFGNKPNIILNMDEKTDDYIELPHEEIDENDDDPASRLDRMLQELAPGTRVLIERTKPSWCSGFLEEIIIDDHLDLDYLITTWGGKQLQIKVRNSRGRLGGKHLIDLNSFEPLRWGKLLCRLDQNDQFDEKKSGTQKNSVVNSPPPSEMSQIMPMFLEMMRQQQALLVEQQQRESNLMLQFFQAQQAAAQRPPANNLAEFSKMANTFGQMKQIFAAQSDAPSTSSDDSGMDFIPQAMDMLKMVMGNQSNKNQSPPKIVRDAPPLPQSLGTVQAIRPPIGDLSTVISSMDPTDAAHTIIGAIGKMNPTDRERAMTAFMQEYQELNDDFDDEEDPQTGVK